MTSPRPASLGSVARSSDVSLTLFSWIRGLPIFAATENTFDVMVQNVRAGRVIVACVVYVHVCACGAVWVRSRVSVKVYVCASGRARARVCMCVCGAC